MNIVYLIYKIIRRRLVELLNHFGLHLSCIMERLIIVFRVQHSLDHLEILLLDH